MIPLVIVGAGGHGQDVAAIVRDINDHTPKYELVGFVDDRKTGPGIIGKLSKLAELDGVSAVLAINRSIVRLNLINRLNHHGITQPTLVHPAATVGDDVVVAPGVVIAAGAVLTTGISLGKSVHVNVGATISQGTHIGPGSTIAPGVHIAGDVTVGTNVTFGCGAVTKNLVKIGDDITVGAGAVVVDDLLEPGTYVGVPARKR